MVSCFGSCSATRSQRSCFPHLGFDWSVISRNPAKTFGDADLPQSLVQRDTLAGQISRLARVVNVGLPLQKPLARLFSPSPIVSKAALLPWPPELHVAAEESLVAGLTGRCRLARNREGLMQFREKARECHVRRSDV